jgi:hypothetical protein
MPASDEQEAAEWRRGLGQVGGEDRAGLAQKGG